MRSPGEKQYILSSVVESLAPKKRKKGNFLMIIIEANNFAPDTPVTLNPGPCGRHPLYRLWRSQFEPVEDNFVINLVLRNSSRKRRTPRSTHTQTTFWEVLVLYRHTKTRKRFDLFQKGLLRKKNSRGHMG